MRISKKIYLISILFCLLNILKAQNSNCTYKNDDTSKCYIKQIFKKPKIILEKKWESTETTPTEQVPLIADMDGDCIPEIMISGINNFDDKDLDTFSFHFIDSRKGISKHKFDCFDFMSENITPLIADVDNDGIKDIIYSSYEGSPFPQGFIVCYEYSGRVKWLSDQYFYNSNYDPGAPSFGIADFNQDGKPEIYCNNRIFNGQTGVLLAEGGLNGVGSNYTIGALTHQVSVAAQLDGDYSDLELAAGFSIYKIKINNLNGIVGNTMNPFNIQVEGKYLDGKTAVADINMDGQLDVIVSYGDNDINSRLYVYTLEKGLPKLITNNFIPGKDIANGCPSIADIDGNGIPNILVSKQNWIHDFEFDGTNSLKLLWSLKVQDTFAYTGISTFDLNGDGIQEIFYRDHHFIYVIDGSSIPPQIIDKKACIGGTFQEYPVIADIDNTGQAKICTICRTFYDSAFYGRLTIFGSPDTLPGWAPARPIWNQYAYNPLYINDDLTVPQNPKNQATYMNGKYNNFMQQESLLDSNGMFKKPAASLTGQIKCINYDPLTNEYIVVFDLYNRKDASNQADSNLAVSFYNGDPTSSGTLIGIYYTLKTIFAGDSLLNLEYRFSSSNLKDLFMVVNTIRNGSGVFDDKDFTQAECDYTDNISRTLELPKLDSIQAKICKGASFQFLDTTLQDPGIYYRKLSTINGCDSLIYILNLSTVDTIYIKQSVAACDVYSWNNKLITQSGIYVFDTLNQFGCDSIISLDLIINKSSVNKTQHTACDSYTWNGQTYDKSGFYTFQTMNQAGCDSTINLEIIIHKSDTTNITIETCDTYVWNGRTYIQSGIYTLDTMNQNGCDSSLTLDLSINSIIQMSTSQSTCDSLIWNGITYTQSGIYKDTTQSSKGCDSITILQLIISKSNQSLTTQTSCNSYSWNGTTYTKSGTYTFATQNAAGCDSIATLQLTINPSTNSTININTCDSLIWNKIIYKQSGTYKYTTLNGSGCDSIATLNLIIHPSNHIRIQQTACNSYTWNGTTYTQSGSYNYQTINSKGCDSITTLDLNIIPSSIKDTSITICDSITFLNKTLNANGNYTFTLQNTLGCDSVINLNLNINSQHYRSNVSTCGSYQWSVNGISYDSSGIYESKYTNHSSCDSIYQLDLTIHKNYEIKEKAEVCKEYLWPVNKVLYTQSGDYIYPLKTNHGCDSIIKLNLLVNSEFQHADTVTTTDAYTWPINQKTYPTSGTYKEIYTTKEGCDSIHLLLLSINKDVSIYYPNIIHPGGLNSFFTIYVYGASATIKTLSIYDRWGERIWQKQNFPPNELQQGWDGKYKDQDVMPGVYVWHAEIELKDGSVITEKGDVTMVR
ncbi:MAG: VCBS repeat-containing protein [Saprospiraceae bacterium]|uniref:VCBS repeat-containing protein n=1 Tax=Candidatus Defluviibacterium haderslevense TaxID=2981993 RepID=A0A9D7S8W8_9BACT|nr:VCBS repeat-containing protein [Candidatus Defluviibacterium haderslevense]